MSLNYSLRNLPLECFFACRLPNRQTVKGSALREPVGVTPPNDSSVRASRFHGTIRGQSLGSAQTRSVIATESALGGFAPQTPHSSDAGVAPTGSHLYITWP